MVDDKIRIKRSASVIIGEIPILEIEIKVKKERQITQYTDGQQVIVPLDEPKFDIRRSKQGQKSQ